MRQQIRFCTSADGVRIACAIAYAARRPERVSQLVLYGTYARGRLMWSARIRRARGELDVAALAGRVAVPTLVLHARDDARPVRRAVRW